MKWYLDEVFPWEFVIREVPENATYTQIKNGRYIAGLPKLRGIRAKVIGDAIVYLWNSMFQ
jgi:hypothetical protein